MTYNNVEVNTVFDELINRGQADLAAKELCQPAHTARTMNDEVGKQWANQVGA